MNNIKVSVIICTYSFKRLNDTVDAINSILQQTYHDVELIIAVDHNQGLLKCLKELYPKNALFAYNDLKKGLSDTRNAGIERSTGDIVAFIDDDATADKHWIEMLVSNYTNPDILGVGGSLIPAWDSKRPWWFPQELDWIIGCTYEGHSKKKKALRNIIGCNMSFRKRVFECVGGFNSDIGRLNNIPLAGEEPELCIRLIQYFQYGIIFFEPDAVVYHKVDNNRLTIKYIFKRSFCEGFSKALISKLFNASVLSTENNYLKFLLFQSIPKYLYKNLFKAMLITYAIGATGCGYVYGLFMTYFRNKNRTATNNHLKAGSKVV
jgi:glycosyltransferase involved in cell wall biosynthesis